MKSYFEKRPTFGKALPEQNKEDVDNIRGIFEVEDLVETELVAIEARGNFYRRHILDIQRKKIYAQHRNQP